MDEKIIKNSTKSRSSTKKTKDLDKAIQNLEQSSNNKEEKSQNSVLKTSFNLKSRPNPAKNKLINANSSITNKKLISSLKVIENISHTLGISDRERINFDIEQVSENELKIRIVNAAANFKTPWFAIKNEEPYIFMPAEILDVVFHMLKNAQKETFELKLERSIWKYLPVDFGDVWRVAIYELEKSNYSKEPDLDKLIERIRQEHPNLFIDMANFVHNEH